MLPVSSTPRCDSSKTTRAFGPINRISNAESLVERLPRSELTALDFSHFGWEDGAEVYGDAILAWLDGGFARVGGDA